jgi:hypothetical protein
MDRQGLDTSPVTLDIYTHLLPDDDASENMAALDSMGNAPDAPNVVKLRRRS